MLQPKLPQREQGFTLAEVLVSMMITSIFFAVAMQAVVIAAILKARAEQYDEAVTWIQEDLELVIRQASEYDPAPSRCNAPTSAGGLAAGLLNDSEDLLGGIGGTPETDGPRTLGGTPFIRTRTADYATSADPFKLLKLTYTVAPKSGGSAIATVSTEVIPAAALKCP